jgi:GNAT superfamily N-acetyltransferase
VSLNAVRRLSGIGSALLAAVEAAARQAGSRGAWVITTNDNLDALRLYQRRGYRLAAVHPGAMDETRRLKPGIPDAGKHGIPLRDEIELEKPLG